MDPRLQELADDIVALKSKAARLVSGEFSKTMVLVDEKLDEILELLDDAPKYATSDNRRDEDAVPYVVPDSPDDLTRIKGIDPVLAQDLRRLGVENFKTISHWTRSDIGRIGRELNLESRIQRENWIEQAAMLAAGNSTVFAETAKQGYVVISDQEPRVAKRIEVPEVSETFGQETTELFTDSSVSEPMDPPRMQQSNEIQSEDQVPEHSQVQNSEESNNQDPLPVQGREENQNFFRPPQPDSESVRTSDERPAIPEQTRENVEDQEKGRRQEADIHLQQESRSEDDNISQEIDASDDPEQTDTHEEVDQIEEDRREADPHEVPGKEIEDKKIERKQTFPDFKQFGDPSTLAEVEIVHHKSGERIKIKNPPDVPRSQQPVEDSKSGDSRGAMRRFIRAIVKSDQK